MCFSATASFTASALLLPAGVYAVRYAQRHDSRAISLAGIPIAFAIQQACEGMVSLSIHDTNPAETHQAALGFLAFAYWFWLFWSPWSVAQLESQPTIRRISQIFSLLGFVYGALLYLPLVLQSNWLTVQVAHHAIQYETRLIFDKWMSQQVDRCLYALIVVTPYFIASSNLIKILGGLVLSSAIVTDWMLNDVFVSVWCFCAAIISLYIVYVVSKISKSITQTISSPSN